MVNETERRLVWQRTGGVRRRDAHDGLAGRRAATETVLSVGGEDEGTEKFHEKIPSVRKSGKLSAALVCLSGICQSGMSARQEAMASVSEGPGLVSRLWVRKGY